MPFSEYLEETIEF